MPAAVTDAYVDPQDYKAVTRKPSGAADGTIAGDLLASTRTVEKFLGRFFTQDAAAVSRIFTPPHTRRRTSSSYYAAGFSYAEAENPWSASGASRVLNVDDLVSVTSIQIDEARDNTFSLTLTTNDYELLPRNAGKGSEPWPYTQIEVTPWGSQWAWPIACRVKVTGVWGWPSVPQPIIDAVIDLTRIRRHEMPESLQAVQTEEAILDGIRSYGRVGL